MPQVIINLFSPTNRYPQVGSSNLAQGETLDQDSIREEHFLVPRHHPHLRKSWNRHSGQAQMFLPSAPDPFQGT